jgi:hypothetical protein
MRIGFMVPLPLVLLVAVIMAAVVRLRSVNLTGVLIWIKGCPGVAPI